MTAAVHSRAFPDVVWSSAVLRGLDARARGEIEAAGKIRSTFAGEKIFSVGQPADALFVVVKGRVAIVARKRGDAEPSALRHAEVGESFGEEAALFELGTRQCDARVDKDGAIAEIPLTLLRRALVRSGQTSAASALERTLMRAATRDTLRTATFARRLTDRDLEMLLDAAEHRKLARGNHVYRENDPAEHAFVVLDGLLQAQTDDAGAPRIEAYFARGDMFGDVELEDRAGRRTSVVAAGSTWLIAISREVFLAMLRRHRADIDRTRRLSVGASLPVLQGTQTTAHIFKDLYRMRVARSLLVIDQNACVRCGHCAWSCASAHDDGISRLVRRGDKVIARRKDEAAGSEDRAPIMVPNSCQHCKNPSCMIDCPTGAIGRDARGEVFIREDLCTGCGSCAKACPWDNIQMAPRKDKRGFAEIAVKCDLCRGAASGPACVSSCPTQAIARIDPNRALTELRVPVATVIAKDAALETSPLPQRAPAWPWVLGAALAALGLSNVTMPKVVSGGVAAGFFVSLGAYAAFKRAPRLASRAQAAFGDRLGGATVARVMFVAHLAFGFFAIGAALAHTRGHAGSGTGGALFVTFLIAAASGAFGSVVQAIVPARLSRLEERSFLPEDLAERTRDLEQRLYAELSGTSELKKKIYARVTGPYARSRVGAVLLVLSGATLREERRRVRARIDVVLEGRGKDGQDRIDTLVRLAVERRALRAQRVLSALLRGWIFLHVAASASSLLLLAVHGVAAVLR